MISTSVVTALSLSLVSVLGISSVSHAEGDAPLVLITQPELGSYITIDNYEEFTVSGFCSENGRSVSMTSPRFGSATCVNNAWSFDFDVSNIYDGDLTFTAEHTNS